MPMVVVARGEEGGHKEEGAHIYHTTITFIHSTSNNNRGIKAEVGKMVRAPIVLGLALVKKKF